MMVLPIVWGLVLFMSHSDPAVAEARSLSFMVELEHQDCLHVRSVVRFGLGGPPGPGVWRNDPLFPLVFWVAAL